MRTLRLLHTLCFMHSSFYWPNKAVFACCKLNFVKQFIWDALYAFISSDILPLSAAGKGRKLSRQLADKIKDYIILFSQRQRIPTIQKNNITQFEPRLSPPFSEIQISARDFLCLFLSSMQLEFTRVFAANLDRVTQN